MLHLLPIELLSHILRSTLPSPYSPLNYRRRQDELRRLCQVSRLFKDEAQRMLFEVVELRAEWTLCVFLKTVKAREDLGRPVKSVMLYEEGMVETEPDRWEEDYEGEGWLRPSHEDFRSLAETCPNVVDLHLVGMPVSLQSLEGFSRLRRLILALVQLDSQPFHLPTLHELSACYVSAEPDSPHLLGRLTSITVPSLSALHLEVETSSEILQLSPPLFLPHVPAMSIGDCSTIANSHPGALGRIPSSALRTVNFFGQGRGAHWSPEFSLAPSLRLQGYSYLTMMDSKSWQHDAGPAATAVRLLDALASSCAETPPSAPLRTVYLPDLLSPLSPVHPNLDPALSSLLSACRSRNIEIIYEPPIHWQTDSLVSPAYTKRCVAEKEKKERGGQA